MIILFFIAVFNTFYPTSGKILKFYQNLHKNAVKDGI